MEKKDILDILTKRIESVKNTIAEIARDEGINSGMYLFYTGKLSAYKNAWDIINYMK